jgi:hypothetical protein
MGLLDNTIDAMKKLAAANGYVFPFLSVLFYTAL